MDDLNIFLTLTPIDRWGLAADAFRLPHSSARYVKPTTFDDGPSRETTPGDSVHEETPLDDLRCFHRIQLRFDQDTKVKGRITFGSDPDRCDVPLAAKRRQYGISGLHFCITFDDQKRPVIRDMSKRGLIVSYDREAQDERRSHFQWIFFPGYRTIKVTLPLQNNQELAFNVHLPQHYRIYQNIYKDNVERFIDGAPLPHEVDFDNLDLRSQGTSFAPSESLSPSKRPVYLKRRELGKGAFGRVRKVVNASTGHTYAGKEFFDDKGWEKEIEIMRHLYHDHIVQFVDFRTALKPLLIMEYLPLGNLQKQDKASSISDHEMMVVFKQCLEGLSYLHNQNITHRDLKPENILLRSRTPIHIKLADFGMAQNRSDLKTFCGSPRYAAPEIFVGQYYTDAVDIWSLAVIVMKFMYGLGQYQKPKNLEARRELRLWGQAWCRFLIKAADDWDSDKVIDFLIRYMLRWEPQERLSAAECLSTASQLGLFDESNLQTGDRTPQPEPDRGTDDNTEEASTIREPLWQSIGSSVRDDGNAPRSQGLSPSCVPEHDQVEEALGRFEPRSEDGDASLVSRERYNRAVKRRRTTNDFGPSVRFPDSFLRLGGHLLPQTASDGDQNGSQHGEQYTTRQAIADEASDEDDDIPELPAVKPPLQRRGRFVLQFTEKQDAFLRIADRRINFTTDTSPTGPWIDIQTARELCATANLGERFGPLLTFGEGQPTQVPVISAEAGQQKVQNEAAFPGFTALTFNEKTVLVRDADHWINATQILRAAGFDRSPFSWQNQNFPYDRVTPFGVFVPVDIAIEFCGLYNLPELDEILREKFHANRPRLAFACPPQRQKSNFHLVNCGEDIVAVRRNDLKVNLTHIFKASPAHPRHRDALLTFKRRNPAVEVVRGDPKIQGSYADFSLAINLCHLLGLSLIAETLSELRLVYNPERGNEKVILDNLSSQDKRPLVAAQPEGILTQPWLANDRNGGDDFGPETNFSEIDRLLQIPRPSFRFMTPSQPAQLGMDHRHNIGGMEEPGQWTSEINLSSIIIPSDLSCFKDS